VGLKGGGGVTSAVLNAELKEGKKKGKESGLIACDHGLTTKGGRGRKVGEMSVWARDVVLSKMTFGRLVGRGGGGKKRAFGALVLRPRGKGDLK